MCKTVIHVKAIYVSRCANVKITYIRPYEKMETVKQQKKLVERVTICWNTYTFSLLWFMCASEKHGRHNKRTYIRNTCQYKIRIPY